MTTDESTTSCGAWRAACWSGKVPDIPCCRPRWSTKRTSGWWGSDKGIITFENRRYFFASASNALRRILVDSARQKAAGKRGGGRRRVEFFPEATAAPEAEADLLNLHDALDRLAEREPRIAELVQLRFFGGLTLKDAATVVSVSERTAQLDWAYARA